MIKSLGLIRFISFPMWCQSVNVEVVGVVGGVGGTEEMEECDAVVD